MLPGSSSALETTRALTNPGQSVLAPVAGAQELPAQQHVIQNDLQIAKHNFISKNKQTQDQTMLLVVHQVDDAAPALLLGMRSSSAAVQTYVLLSGRCLRQRTAAVRHFELLPLCSRCFIY